MIIKARARKRFKDLITDIQIDLYGSRRVRPESIIKPLNELFDMIEVLENEIMRLDKTKLAVSK